MSCGLTCCFCRTRTSQHWCMPVMLGGRRWWECFCQELLNQIAFQQTRFAWYIIMEYVLDKNIFLFFYSSTVWQPCIWPVIMVTWESSKWWLHPREPLEWILMSTTRDFEMVEAFFLLLRSLIVVSSRSCCWEGQRWDSISNPIHHPSV